MEYFGEKERLLIDIAGLFLDDYRRNKRIGIAGFLLGEYQRNKHIGVQIDVAEGSVATRWYELGKDGALPLPPVRCRRLASKLALRFWELSGRNFATLFLAIAPSSEKYATKTEKTMPVFVLPEQIARYLSRNCESLLAVFRRG